MEHKQRRNSALFALAAYIWWGGTPIFWKLLSHVPSLEILCHRIIWSFVFFLPLFARPSAREKLKEAGKQKQQLLFVLVSTLLIGLNWGTFIVAMVTDRMLESSLGYYIAPLAMVLLAVVLLKEKLSALQAVAVAAAAVGVVVYGSQVDGIPWIALGLASTFAFYGYFKKRTELPVWLGIAVETGLLSVPAILYLAFAGTPHDLKTWGILMAAGPITALPQIWFALGARGCPYALVGILQFISPTLVAYLAVAMFHEPLGTEKVISFALIGAGAMAFVWDLWRRSRAVPLVRT